MIMRIPILKSILRNLDWFEEARRHHVAPDGSILLGGTNHRLKKDGDWEESKHPRADNGQFGSGSGTSRGGSKKPKPSKTKRKMERRAEAAGQARVGGAIQSLLSGGSALDKIGWLKPSEKPAESMTAEKKPSKAGTENPPHVDMSGVPKDKALITGSVSVSYDTKVPTKHTSFSGGEDSPAGEHVHSEDTGYITVPNVENFIHVQTHNGESGWYPDIYNNTRRTNYYPGSKENALTNIAAHPDGPKADELYPTLKDAIASVRSIPKEYSTSPHSNKPPKTFDGAAVLEEYYRTHPEKRPRQPEKPKAEEKPKQSIPGAGQQAPPQPEKPKAEEKPKPADKAEAAKQEIANNIKSGKLKKETVVAAVKTMYEQANAAERRGDSKTARELDLKAEIMTDGAGIKGELYSAGILQMRGKPLMSIGEGMETRSGKPRNYINSLETAHRIENYRNKVVTWGEVLDEFKEDEDNLGLYQYNGKTYLVDYDHPDQFGTMSPDSWRRLKDELTGDDETPVRTSHKPSTQFPPPTKSPQVTEAASSDILQHGKKIDEHGKASLHEYSGGFYMVTQGNPHGMRISKPAWESMKYS